MATRKANAMAQARNYKDAISGLSVWIIGDPREGRTAFVSDSNWTEGYRAALSRDYGTDWTDTRIVDDVVERFQENRASERPKN